MGRLRVGVNLLPLRPAVMGGAGEYVRVLLTHLAAEAGAEYVVVAPPDDGGLVPEAMRAARVSPPGTVRGATRRVLERVLPRRGPLGKILEPVRVRHRRRVAGSLAELMVREHLDVWFCPLANLQPRDAPVPTVITVLDLQHEHFPAFFDPAELAHRRAFYPASCRAAGRVIAISGFVRDDVITRYGVPPARVSVVWLAPGDDLDWAGARALIPAVRARYRLPRRYVFYPANAWPHKNHGRLLEALALYRSRAADAVDVVLTGDLAGARASIEAAAVRLGVAGAVHLLGYVPREHLPPLYAGAACLALPSLFEGFALPLVEAMRAGCPIVAADVASVPEVAGDAAVLFDPWDPAALARALARVIDDPEAAATLARRGRARAARFSASIMAARTLEILERVAAEGRASIAPERG